MDRETGESISGVEEEVYKETSVSSTRLRFKKWEWKLIYYIMQQERFYLWNVKMEDGDQWYSLQKSLN